MFQQSRGGRGERAGGEVRDIVEILYWGRAF